MKISELVEKLEKIKSEKGDLEVRLEDSEFGGSFKLKAVLIRDKGSSFSAEEYVHLS